MPAPLLRPRVPLGFPPLATAGGQTTHPGHPTVPGTKAGGQTVSPGGQTAPRTESHPAEKMFNRQDLRRSFVTCFTDFGRPPCSTHDFGCAPHDTLDSTRRRLP
jgi:hypothetical protein